MVLPVVVPALVAELQRVVPPVVVPADVAVQVREAGRLTVYSLPSFRLPFDLRKKLRMTRSTPVRR